LKFSTGKPNEAISYTIASTQINTSGKSSTNPRLAVNSYYNLGYYLRELNRYKDALVYFDLCTITGNAFNDSATLSHVVNARIAKAKIYHQTGDFQKAIEETAFGLRTAMFINSPAKIATLLNERALAYSAMNQFSHAMNDVNKAALFTDKTGSTSADNFKVKATISEGANNYREAMAYHKRAIAVHSKNGDTASLSNDYLDAGNTLRKEAMNNKTEDYRAAINHYIKAAQLAQKSGNNETAIKATNNLAAIAFRTKKYTDAATGYHKSLLQVVPSFKNNNALSYPTHRQCNPISDKNFLSLLLANKAECLLYLYKQTQNKYYINAALNTALLTDSLITDMRHEQTGEQSKLYWRSETREFFTNAIEACYEANDPSLALYFMEKSRAVLLNDKLAELGASAKLPAAEAAEEQRLQINVFWQQQKVAGLSNDDPAYREEELKLFSAKEALQRYINALQTAYPAYHQYKYADAVPRLQDLQKYLAAAGQSFVHYFINDTAIYILAITPSSSKLIKQNKNNFSTDLSQFLKTCSDVQRLNNHYEAFAAQAYHIYQLLFKPVGLSKGRVIICYDAVMIPFEALTTDPEGTNFLIKDHSFSYVYSAQALLKRFKNPSGKGAFLGVAPVSYAANLSVPSLLRSGTSLQKSSVYYTNNKLITGSLASRSSLLSNLPNYSIVTILSHARADSSDKEPILFMADSVIRLSELQLLRNPSTELIVLSACQTNVGRLATGEGVFSLTRGFASAGIPCITATLWKADEEAIYGITQLFLKNIAEGMRKDDALQDAKLSFMQDGGNKNLLPYYWANMILAGNGEPITPTKNNHNIWWLIGSFLLVSIVLLFIFRKKRKYSLS
jgi:CHAT domain-containing protein/tetratricopeptide (TPR) repeat protein